jgi:zinc/manganese transport system substrate-binding protein
MKVYFQLFFLISLICYVSPASAVVRVVSTIPDFSAIAKEVGGQLVETEALVKPTQDPHFVDAKPSLVVKLNRAHLLLVTGMDLERGWLPPLVTGARNSRIQKGSEGYLDCSTLIAPKEVKTPDRAQGDVHPNGNPHYWIDPRNGILLARGIAERLMMIDPQNRASYMARRDRFIDRLEEKIADWAAKLTSLSGGKVVVYHESWVYFLDWAELRQAGALEPKPGIPPKPSHVAELLNRARDQEILFVLQESYYPTRVSQLYADKAGARLKVLPTMVGAAGTTDYIDLVNRLVEELTK